MIYFEYEYDGVWLYRNRDGSDYLGRVLGATYTEVQPNRRCFYNNRGERVAILWGCEPIAEICPTCGQEIKED